MKKILFFTQYGGRTGSEMLLWYILERFDRKLFQAQLFCNWKGELIDLLPNDVKFHVQKYNLLDRVLSKIIKPAYQNKILYEKQIVSIHNQFQPDYWYFNTIAMAELIPIARKLGVKVISHFHELPWFFETLSENELENLIEYSHAIIGCSEAVCERVRVLRDKNVYLQHEFIDTTKVITQNDKAAQIRQELNIGLDDFVWILSGSRVYNKGIDILPEIANYFGKEGVHFVWLGGHDSGLVYYVKKLIEKYDTKNVHFLGARKEDYYDYLALGNAFLLLSREDSFPLVMLEAAYLGKPIVAFNSGGVKEFVLDGMGKVVDSRNTIDLIKEMENLMSGEIKVDKKTLKERALEFSVEDQIYKWQNIINDITNDDK